MLSYYDDGWFDEDGYYHPADLPDPDLLDWGDDFDDFDAADWEHYLGGPDEDVFEAALEAQSLYDDGDDWPY